MSLGARCALDDEYLPALMDKAIEYYDEGFVNCALAAERPLRDIGAVLDARRPDKKAEPLPLGKVILTCRDGDCRPTGS